MKYKKIIIDIPFNISFKDHFPQRYKKVQNTFDQGFAISQTKGWIDYRIKIFMKYTATSIMNQSNQNFLCILRYSESTKFLIDEALANYPKLPDNIVFVTNSEAEQIIDDTVNNYEYLFHVRVDSDNMYDIDFISIVDKYEVEENIDCILCHEGYMYDETTNRVAELYHSSPSFYVDIYNKETYKLYFKDRLFEVHMDVCKTRKYISIPGYRYMIVVHESNLDNEFDPIVNWLKGKVVSAEKRDKILEQWSIK